MNATRQLLARFAKDITPGTLTWVGVRPARKAAMIELEQVLALAELGLEGDHRCSKTPGSGRQVTIISREYIQQIEHFTGLDVIAPAILRRNLVVANLNLGVLRHQQFTIGEALFEANALCHPCSRMEQALGRGGVAAMMGHGGLCARILRSGRIRVGDTVTVLT